MRALRCTVLCFPAAMMFGVGHAVARVLASGRVRPPDPIPELLGVLERQVGIPADAIFIDLAPLLWSAVVGLGSAWIYRQVREPTARMFFLYLSTLGAMSVFLHLLPTVASGPLREAVIAAGLSPVALAALSILGALGLLVVMWQAGARLLPPVKAVAIPVVASALLFLAAHVPPSSETLTVVGAAVMAWGLALVASLTTWARSGDIDRSRLAQLSVPWSAVIASGVLIWLARVVRAW